MVGFLREQEYLLGLGVEDEAFGEGEKRSLLEGVLLGVWDAIPVGGCSVGEGPLADG